MWPTHSFQRHLCVLLLTSAVIISLLVLKNRARKAEGGRKGDVAPRVVHVLGLFELTTKGGRRAESEIAAAQLAIRHVNQRRVLPDGYTLKLLINDSKCDPGVGIDAFFHAIYSAETIVALLGTTCSNVTESLAHVVPYWNVLQISFGSTSPSLSDRKKFPLFFRTIAPDSSHNSAKLAFVKHFGWRVIATFCQSENEYLLPLNSLISEFENENVSCVSTITFSVDNYREQLRLVKNSDIRIIIGAFAIKMAKDIFCEIHRLRMFGEDYVWIVQDRQDDWWRWQHHGSPCTSEQLQEAADGLILVGDHYVVAEGAASISGLNNDLFERELNAGATKAVSKYARLTYDAVWVMALAFKGLKKATLDDFNYKRSDIVCEFIEQISQLNFTGISVSGRIVDVAVYDANRETLDFKCDSCERINWHNKQRPIAQRILKMSLVHIPEALLYSIIFVACLGIAFCLFFLYFNLHFRRIKSVKISSPKLNNVAVVGCMLVYFFVILAGFHTTKMSAHFDELCTVSVYLLSAGCSLAFGSMFAKTYRIHRIFAYSGGASKVKDKLLKDKQLIALILIPLLIDAIILTLWIMIDPMHRQLYNLTLEMSSEDRGIVYQPQVEVCRSRNTFGWLVAIYGYKGIILVMGVFMAWETRHVKVQALNDAHYIGICVYGALFTAIITILSSFISEHVILSYLARTVAILTSTTVTLFLLFLPKLKSVFGERHPSQDPVMQSMGLKMECNTRRFINTDPKEQILRLEIQNKVFRCELEALDLEIGRLERLTAVYTTCKGGARVGWGSWPEPLFLDSRSRFLSENDFGRNKEGVGAEKVPLIEKMKWLLGNLRRSSGFCPGIESACNPNHKSNPEVCGRIGNRHDMTKAKSEMFSLDSIL